MAILDALANGLPFLAEPWFAIPWFVVGAAGAAWIIRNSNTANSALNPPLKACWPIITFFFSIVGIALYLVASRPPGIGRVHGRMEKMRRFTEFSQPRWRKVIASATHCVGGDGLGIMTAMAGARIMGFHFWTEFWFEYAVGFAFGWFIFQTWALRLHGNGWLASIWKGGRAEFFSMITVMVGMGLVMRFVTPAVVGMQPLPNTYAFWTFGALGLMVGFVLTYPTNWVLVAIGWKHGQGMAHMLKQMEGQHDEHHEEHRPDRRRRRHGAAAGGRTVVGIALFAAAPLALPAHAAVQDAQPPANGLRIVRQSLAAAMDQSATALRAGRRHEATMALDRARRLSRFAHTASGISSVQDSSTFAAAHDGVAQARHDLQMGRPLPAAARLEIAAHALLVSPFQNSIPEHPAARIIATVEGRPVLDAYGNEIGAIEGFAAPGNEVLIAVGGTLGIGLGAHTVAVPASRVLLGGEYAVLLGETPPAP